MDAKTKALQMAQADALLGHSCGCVGPQNGQPLCPCKMRGVIVRDGRYVMPERDLGPVRPAPLPPIERQSFAPYRRGLWDGF